MAICFGIFVMCQYLVVLINPLRRLDTFSREAALSSVFASLPKKGSSLKEMTLLLHAAGTWYLGKHNNRYLVKMAGKVPYVSILLD